MWQGQALRRSAPSTLCVRQPVRSGVLANLTRGWSGRRCVRSCRTPCSEDLSPSSSPGLAGVSLRLLREASGLCAVSPAVLVSRLACRGPAVEFLFGVRFICLLVPYSVSLSNCGRRVNTIRCGVCHTTSTPVVSRHPTMQRCQRQDRANQSRTTLGSPLPPWWAASPYSVRGIPSSPVRPVLPLSTSTPNRRSPALLRTRYESVRCCGYGERQRPPPRQ